MADEPTIKPETGQGAPRAHRRRLHGLQARPRGDRRRPGQGRHRCSASEGQAAAAKKAGRDAREGQVVLVHPRRRPPGRAHRGQLRDRLRGPQRRLPEAGPRPRDAGRGLRARCTRPSSPSRPSRGRAQAAELLADEIGHVRSPRPIREKIVEGQLAQVVPAGRALRAALPRHRADRRPARHRRHRHASARTSASAASCATSSGRSCDATAPDAEPRPAGRRSRGGPLPPDPAQALR